METVDEMITGGSGGSKDVSLVVKGKRTKRQRPQSPIPFTIAATTNSSSSNGGEYCYNNATETTTTNVLSSSPATSSDYPTGSTTTEDEDTAKCLILLSRGPPLIFHHQQQQPTKIMISNHSHDRFPASAAVTYKFNSKRYIETPTSAGNGKAGIYVYECKTCSRTFPSFQALGGHRASHKKPKNAASIFEDVKRKPFHSVYSDDDEPSPVPSRSKKLNHSSSSSSLSLQLTNRVSFGMNKISSNKLHECSICGAGFNSGQALGGHMRRHRVPPGGGTNVATTATITMPTLALIPLVSGSVNVKPIHQEEEEEVAAARNDHGLCLDLDLNLPAPAEEDQHRESKFGSTNKQQQEQQQREKQQPAASAAVVLSAGPTLVDCHY